MASKFKPTRILGHVVNTSPSAMNAREDPENKDGYIPEDASLLTSLRVLQKNKAPLGDREQILQFFRWTASKEKYPLPPLVRKILCMNRAKLVDAMDSMKTTDPIRTYEKKAIAEIDRFLREDGVLHPDDDMQCKTTTEKGTWLRGGVVPEPSAPAETSAPCDLTPVLTKLNELQATSATRDLLTEQLNSLKTFIQEECCKKESCSGNQAELTKARQRVAELELEIQKLNNKIGELNATIQSLEKRGTELEQQKDAEILSLRAKINELEEIQKSISSEGDLNIKKLQEQLQTLIEEKDKLETQILVGKNARISSLEQELANAQKLAERVQELEAQLNNAKQNSSTKNETIENLQSQLNAAKESADKIPEMQSRLNTIVEKNARISSLEQELANAQKLAERVQELEQELNNAKQNSSTKNETIENLQSQLNAAKESADKIPEMQSRLNTIVEKNARISSLEQELKKIELLTNQVSELNQELSIAENEKAQLEEQNQKQLQIGQNKNNSIQLLDEAILKKNSEITELQTNLESANQLLREQVARIQPLQTEISELKKQLDLRKNLETQISSLTTQITQLQEASQKKNREKTELQSQLDETRKSFERLQNTHLEYNKIKDSLIEFDKKFTSLKTNRNLKAEEIKKLNQQLQEENKKVSDLESRSKKEIKELNANLNKLQEEYNNYTRDTEKEITEKNNKIANLEKQLEVAKKQVTPFKLEPRYKKLFDAVQSYGNRATIEDLTDFIQKGLLKELVKDGKVTDVWQKLDDATTEINKLRRQLSNKSIGTRKLRKNPNLSNRRTYRQ